MAVVYLGKVLDSVTVAAETADNFSFCLFASASALSLQCAVGEAISTGAQVKFTVTDSINKVNYDHQTFGGTVSLDGGSVSLTMAQNTALVSKYLQVTIDNTDVVEHTISVWALVEY